MKFIEFVTRNILSIICYFQQFPDHHNFYMILKLTYPTLSSTKYAFIIKFLNIMYINLETETNFITFQLTNFDYRLFKHHAQSVWK